MNTHIKCDFGGMSEQLYKIYFLKQAGIVAACCISVTSVQINRYIVNVLQASSNKSMFYSDGSDC